MRTGVALVGRKHLLAADVNPYFDRLQQGEAPLTEWLGVRPERPV